LVQADCSAGIACAFSEGVGASDSSSLQPADSESVASADDCDCGAALAFRGRAKLVVRFRRRRSLDIVVLTFPKIIGGPAQTESNAEPPTVAAMMARAGEQGRGAT
jgi:hypothetical protein